MKKFFKRLNPRPKTFESEFEKLTAELVQVCFEYVNFDSENVQKIFIYVSTELDTIWFNTFYKINDELHRKHKVGEKYDTSSEMQYKLIEVANSINQKLIQNFRKHSKDVPTELRITYAVEGGKFNCDLKYDAVIADNPELDWHSLCEEWMESEKLSR